MPQSDVLDRLMAMPEDRRNAVIDTLSPAQRTQLADLFKTKNASAPASGPRPAGTTVDLTGTFKGAEALPPSQKQIDERKFISRQEFRTNQPESTVGTRAREAAIGVLEPLTIGSLRDTAKAAGTVVSDLLTGDMTRNASAIPNAAKFAEGVVTAPLQPIANLQEAIRTEDWDAAAGAAGGILSQTVPAVAGVLDATVPRLGETIAANTPKVPSLPDLNLAGRLRETAREAAQWRTGTSTQETIAPMAEKVAGRQTAADVTVADRNTAAEAAAREATDTQQSAAAQRNANEAIKADIKTDKNRMAAEEARKTATADASTKTSEQTKAYDEKVRRQQEAHAKAVAETEDWNKSVEADKARAAAMDDDLKAGSEVLGQRAHALENTLREELNAEAEPIHTANAKETAPISEVIQVAKEKLAGSEESTTLFNRIAKRFNAGGKEFLDDTVGGIDKTSTGGGDSVPYRHIRALITELGTELSKGNLPGDVYQAFDVAHEGLLNIVQEMSKKTGTLDAFNEFRKHYREKMELFDPQKSALGKVRNRVKYRLVDPEFYSEPFTTGKAAGVAIDRLRKLTTKFTSETKALADLAEELKAKAAERKGLKPKEPKTLPVPPSPIPPPAPVTPKAVAEPRVAYGTNEPIPEPVVPEIIPRENIPAPSLDEITADRQRDIQSMGADWRKWTRRDAMVVGGGIVGGLIGHDWVHFLGAAAGIEGAMYGLGRALTSDSVAAWIAKPVEADIMAAQKLPPAARAKLVSEIRAAIDRERAAGRNPVVNPAVQRLIGTGLPIAGAASGAVQNRREALERLGRAPK